MLKEHLKNYRIILGSKSPRRHQFFKDLNLQFTVITKPVKEVYPSNLKGKHITNYLAELKSNAYTNLKENDVLITSDTIVWHNKKALEKPKNYDDAFGMLKQLSGKKHKVISSVCVRTLQFKTTFNDTTTVIFKPLTDQEIAYYITNYKPFDKAGAYGIQEWIGLIGIKKIKGSYFNVVGLPVQKLYKVLQQL